MDPRSILSGPRSILSGRLPPLTDIYITVGDDVGEGFGDGVGDDVGDGIGLRRIAPLGFRRQQIEIQDVSIRGPSSAVTTETSCISICSQTVLREAK